MNCPGLCAPKRRWGLLQVVGTALVRAAFSYILRLRVGDSSCAAVVQEAGSSEAERENVGENGDGWLFHCNDVRWCNRMLLNIVTTDGIITLGRVTKIDNGACALGWVWPETRAKFAPKTVVCVCCSCERRGCCGDERTPYSRDSAGD